MAILLFASPSFAAQTKPVVNKPAPKSFSATPTADVTAVPERRRPDIILSIGAEVVLEQEDIESQYAARLPALLRGGIGIKPGDILIEYTYFALSESVGNLALKRTQQTGLAWFRYHLKSLEGGAFRPFVGAAVGAQTESIENTFGSDTETNTSKLQLVGAISTGANFLFWNWLEVGGDFRILASEKSRPNPTVGATFALGARF